jgi:hypothetical protein
MEVFSLSRYEYHDKRGKSKPSFLGYFSSIEEALKAMETVLSVKQFHKTIDTPDRVELACDHYSYTDYFVIRKAGIINELRKVK